MNKEIKISLFGPAIRTNRWLKLYNSITNNNNLNFEIVFCGNVRPQFKLPFNFKFIFSKVKPSQCGEIALSNTTSNLVVLISDDCLFSDNYFDNIYNFYNCNKNYIVGGKFKRNDIFYQKANYMLSESIPDSPIFPMSPILNKKEIYSVGGIDKNFIAVMWHEDLLMRLIIKYSKSTKILDNSYTYEETPASGNLIKRIYKNYFLKKFLGKYTPAGPGLFIDYGYKYDLPFLKSCWIGNLEETSHKEILCKNDYIFISKARLRKVDGFKKNNITDKTQGVRGKW